MRPAPHFPRFLSRVALATLALLSLQGTVLAAADQPRVTVLPSGGDSRSELQKAVSKVIARHGYQMVPTNEFREATARLASTVAGADAIKTVAADLSLV